MRLSGYDAWRTREPDVGPDYTWEMQPHCQVCGCWLKLQPDKVTFEEDKEACDGKVDPEFGETICGRGVAHEPHEVVRWAWSISHRKCRRCGYENQEAE
jgi:hypothetical protein